jgi:hypothetical protein
MKILKIFFVFQLSYIVLVYLSLLVVAMIGWGLNAPKCISKIIRVIVYPVGMVMQIITDDISERIDHFLIVFISSVIIAALFTAMIVGLKAVVKKM